MVHEDFGLAMEASLGLDGTTTKAMVNAASAPATSAAANSPVAYAAAQPQPGAALPAGAAGAQVEENPFTTGNDSVFADAADNAGAVTGGALATSAYTGGATGVGGASGAGAGDNPFASDNFA